MKNLVKTRIFHLSVALNPNILTLLIYSQKITLISARDKLEGSEKNIYFKNNTKMSF